MSLIERDVAQFSADKIINKEHIGRVARWVGGENVPPITVEIDMTDNCNHRCPGCTGGQEGVKALNQPDAIINQLAYFGCKGLIFTGGGEPLVSPKTPEMIAHARKMGLDVALITNGSIMTGEIADTVVNNCTWVRVSLDADGPEMHEAIHGVGPEEYHRVARNIAKLVKAKKAEGSNCTIGIGYLTDERTVGGMRTAAWQAKILGVDYIQFRPFHGDRTPIDDQLEDCLSLEDEGFRVLWSKHKYESMKRGDFGRSYDKCHGQQFATVVAASGKMYVCCHMRGMENYAIGDLNEQSLGEIWGSEHRQAVVDAIDFKDCPPLCRDNTFNQILWEIEKDKDHINFL